MLGNRSVLEQGGRPSLTRAEDIVITRLRIGHTKVTKAHILSRRPPTTCHHCGQTLTIDHMLPKCVVLQESRDEYYTADSLNTLFEDSSRDLHSGILVRSGIILSDVNDQTFYTIPHMKHPRTDALDLTHTSPQTWTT